MYDLAFTDAPMTTWALLRQTWITANKVAEIRLAKNGLTPEHLAVLWICRDHTGPVTTAEIARLVSREGQSISGLLNRMEKEGFVKRIPKRKGRPFTEIKMTAKGEEMCGPAIEVLKKIIMDFAPDMPEKDREQLHQSLKLLRGRMLDRLHVEIDENPPGLPHGKPIQLNW
ncbi:MAG: MarR family transcriptional regulator [Dehalococcoidia bacterium]